MEKVTRFTKGPWKQEAAHIQNDQLDKNENYRRILSGDEYYNSENPNGFGLVGYITEANARLIAEAPVIYELLEKFCVECNKHNLEFFAPEYEEAMTIFQRINKE